MSAGTRQNNDGPHLVNKHSLPRHFIFSHHHLSPSSPLPSAHRIHLHLLFCIVCCLLNNNHPFGFLGPLQLALLPLSPLSTPLLTHAFAIAGRPPT